MLGDAGPADAEPKGAARPGRGAGGTHSGAGSALHPQLPSQRDAGHRREPILFRDGRTVYLQKPRGGCPGLGAAAYTLVTRPFGTTELCDGDISHTVDLVSGIQGGACVFGPFVPYTKPR